MAKQLIDSGFDPANSEPVSDEGIDGHVTAESSGNTETETEMNMQSAMTAFPNHSALASATQAWAEAFDAYKAAIAASDSFDAEYDRISEAYKAEVAGIPHVETNFSGRRVSSADPFEVRSARRSASDIRYVETCAYADVKERQDFVDAVNARDALVMEIDERLGYSEASDRYDALAHAIAEAEETLLRLPAPNGTAVLWKVEHLFDRAPYVREQGPQVLFDLHRFLSDAAKSEPDVYQKAYEHGRDVGREEFARAWLKKFTSHGGSVTIDTQDPNQAWHGQPCFSLSPDYAEYETHLARSSATEWFKGLAPAAQEDKINEIRSLFRDRWEGGMKFMADLLAVVPEGRHTVRDVVQIQPRLGAPTFGSGYEQ
jgi:hypothetical protein